MNLFALFFMIAAQLFFEKYLVESSQVDQFIHTHQNSSIEGVAPTHQEKVSSQTECFMQCKQYKCYFVQIVKQGVHLVHSCSLFKYIDNQSLEKSNIFQLDAETVDGCFGWFEMGATNGVYPIHIAGKKVKVFCEMTSEGGVWTTLLKRFDGSTDFARPWKEYQEGFGEMNGEY